MKKSDKNVVKDVLSILGVIAVAAGCAVVNDMEVTEKRTVAPMKIDELKDSLKFNEKRRKKLRKLIVKYNTYGDNSVSWSEKYEAQNQLDALQKSDLEIESKLREIYRSY